MSLLYHKVLFFFTAKLLLFLSHYTVVTVALSTKNNVVYTYFCYGSNVLPSTMENLRGIQPLNATAALLPGYQLRFDGQQRSKWEPSAAFIVPSHTRDDDDDIVHGVLYTLSAKDFATVGWTEGVPLAYRWHRCTVYPYVGKEGQDIGKEAFLTGTAMPQEALTLISPKTTTILARTNVPPSSSYLGIIQKGARYWKLDASYQAKLAQIPTAQNLIVPGGLSGPLLRFAELTARFRK